MSSTDQELLAWAKEELPKKNTLLEADARAAEAAYQEKFAQPVPPVRDAADDSPQTKASMGSATSDDATAGLALPKEPARKRSKAHLSFVRGQAVPCLSSIALRPSPPEVRATESLGP
ncbi:MAG TPA: hypothetical protein VKY22_09615 [Bradyrhizobium sp.]|nr:hypothetical protein [Bradyrhizobium sp.]